MKNLLSTSLVLLLALLLLDGCAGRRARKRAAEEEAAAEAVTEVAEAEAGAAVPGGLLAGTGGWRIHPGSNGRPV